MSAGVSDNGSLSPDPGDPRVFVRGEIDEVRRLLRRVGRNPSARRVHALRVGTRRAGAVLLAFEDNLEPAALKKTLRRLRAARRLAARLREYDALLQILDAEQAGAPEAEHAALRHAAKETRRLRDRGARDLDWERAEDLRRGLRRAADRLAASMRPPEAGDLRGVANAALERAVRGVEEAAAQDLSGAERIHSLRLALKALRYTVERFEHELPETGGGLAALAQVQAALGAVTDSAAAADRVEAVARGAPADLVPALGAIAERFRSRHDAALAEAARWWIGPEAEALLKQVRASAPAEPPVAPAALAASSPRLPDLGPLPGSPRLAAIDIGSNSIRLIVAEAEPEGTYRVLDDEREVARLAHGVDAQGRIDRAAIARAAESIGRMRRIAEGYGARVVRAVATSAVREATNRGEALAYFRSRAGIEVEVISGEEEARLAWISVGRAFDLTAVNAAVADIGGGSLQVVLAAAGAVEAARSIPVGAVRMTDHFGGPEECAGAMHAPMRRFIAHALRREMGRPAFVPSLLIGTGGTFTTLGYMLAHQRRSDNGRPQSIQGFELQRSELAHILDRLRKLPVRERARVPGLPADRADIIVAGLTAVDCLLEHLGVNSVQVHDRGIRDGLILTMVRDLLSLRPGPEGRPDALAAARRFARGCRYEETHAEHVTRLALSIFDDLAAALPGEWRTGRSRTLLEAAGVLHDVGYLINYSAHHKHSYHLIIHSELEGFTARELEIVANVARYHRRSEPSKRHAAFARLDADDRSLVRRLAAILRIADGLDRTHTQQVTSAHVTVEGGAAEFTIEADSGIETDLWGAQRKLGLFLDAFGLEPRFRLAGSPGPAAAVR